MPALPPATCSSPRSPGCPCPSPQLPLQSWGSPVFSRRVETRECLLGQSGCCSGETRPSAWSVCREGPQRVCRHVHTCARVLRAHTCAALCVFTCMCAGVGLRSETHPWAFFVLSVTLLLFAKSPPPSLSPTLLSSRLAQRGEASSSKAGEGFRTLTAPRSSKGERGCR